MIDLNAYRWFRIEPVDAWFFRDGRPSNRGEMQMDLASEFPPNPPTVVGAIRAALARANGWSGSGSWTSESDELTKILGDGFDNLGQLSFLGPFLCRRCVGAEGPTEELLWPLPMHVVGTSVEGHFVPSAFLCPSSDWIASDLSDEGVALPVVLDATKPSNDAKAFQAFQHSDDVFVTTSGMNAILSGKLPDAEQCVHARELFAHESRVGIFRDEVTRTTGSNAMYSPRYVRLRKGVSLVQGIAGVPTQWSIPQLMTLGGESRLASFEPLDQAPAMPATTSERSPDSSGSPLIIGLTPARFSSCFWGAGPGEDAGKLSGKLSGKVSTVACQRPMKIGGWDSMNLSARPLVPYAPPGTVWWLDGGAVHDGPHLRLGEQHFWGYGLAAVGHAATETQK